MNPKSSDKVHSSGMVESYTSHTPRKIFRFSGEPLFSSGILPGSEGILRFRALRGSAPQTSRSITAVQKDSMKEKGRVPKKNNTHTFENKKSF